jgi:protease-4
MPRLIAWTGVLLVVVALTPLGAAAQDDPLSPLTRQGSSDIPSYYLTNGFNIASPSTWATADGGYANPGVYPMLPGGEGQFFWTAKNKDVLDWWRHWGLFLGGENLGFGAVYNRYPNADGTGTVGVTDYRLALAAGTKAASLGFAFGWSGGEGDQINRTRVIQLGTVQRWTPYVSFGLNGTFSTETRDQSGLFDLGVRPLGDERLALFGSLELPRGVALKNAPWAAGAVVGWPAGLKLVGRYFENETWDFSIVYSFGGAVNTGHLRLSGTPRFDKESEVAYTNWGVRLGYPERGFIGEYFQKDRHYVAMKLKGPVVHTRYKYFDRGHTLMSLITSIDDAKKDPRIKGVALNLSGIQISRGNAWEIREQLIDLQENGKHVVIYFDEADMTVYHLASVADRVVLDPEGMLLLPGYVLGRTYLAGTLEKLGLGFDEWRFLKYKSAAEALSRTSMSDADREQRQALVDGYYETMQADVVDSRNIDPGTFDRWVDDITVVLASVAKKEGLVDDLVRWGDIGDVITELEGKPKSLVSPGSVAGRYFKSERWGEPPKIAVVYAIGACAMDSGIRARQLERLLAGLRKNRDVKAVVLRVNSPGGAPLPSDLVAEEVRKCSKVKPVIVSQGDVAASGGYWLSMYGDEIVAQPTTITGSIGVIGGWIWNKELAEKLGLSADFVARGKHADLFFGPSLLIVGLPVPHRPLTDSEREQIIADMDTLYQRFVGTVAEGRGMTKEEVEKIAQGRVWTGDAGKENGLVDTIGGLDAAIKIAREKAGIDPDEEVRILDYSIKGWFDLSSLDPNPILLGWLWPWGGSANDSEVNAEDIMLAEFFDNYELAYLREIIKNNGRALCIVPPEYLPRDARTGSQDRPLGGPSRASE